jgi:hypothetical protein
MLTYDGIAVQFVGQVIVGVIKVAVAVVFIVGI